MSSKQDVELAKTVAPGAAQAAEPPSPPFDPASATALPSLTPPDERPPAPLALSAALPLEK
jgi:hypothetical protein